MPAAHRSATPAVWLALGLVFATGSGCGAIDPSLINPALLPEHVQVLRIQVPSFDASEIDGIWMWRRSEATGEFEPLSAIELDEPVLENGSEFLDYTLLDASGSPVELSLSTEVVRDGEQAELRLWFIRFAEPGEFKASLYNAAGESALSEQSLFL